MKTILVQSTRDAGHYRLGQYFSRQGVVLAVEDYTEAEWAILEADGYLKLTPEADEPVETAETQADIDGLVEGEQAVADESVEQADADKSVGETATPAAKPKAAKK